MSPIPPETIRFAKNLIDLLNAVASTESSEVSEARKSEAELGRGTFEVYQGTGIHYLCAWVRSEGPANNEQWIWVQGVTAYALASESMRVFSAPGSTSPVAPLWFRHMPGTEGAGLPALNTWKADVLLAANPDPAHPHFALQGVSLASTALPLP